MQPLPSGVADGVQGEENEVLGEEGVGYLYILYIQKNKAVPRDSLCLNRSSNAYYFEMRRSLIRAFLPVRLRR